MLYVIQAILHSCVQNITLTLHCDALLNTTYSNMGFEIYEDFDASILQYFELSDDYKNSSAHMMFRKTMLIDTTKYVYENRTCTGYDNLHFIK